MIHPNTLTLARVVLAPVVALLLFFPHFEMRVAAFVVFTIAALTDLWDGYIARKRKQESDFGKILDPIADKVLVLVTMATFSGLNVYPFWLLVPILVREIVVTLVRLKVKKRGLILSARPEGKLKTNVQIVSLILSYVYVMVRDYGGTPDLVELFYCLNFFILGIAIFFTLYSGYCFFVDNKLGAELVEVLATGFYLGHLPRMPGTYGTVLGLLIACLAPKNLWVYGALLIVLVMIAIWVSDKYAKAKGQKDPVEVVIDEVVGAMVTVFAIPLNLFSLVAGFFLFRFFDIRKPFPVRACENLRGGVGIVVDDFAAALYANLSLVALKFIYSFIARSFG